MQPLLITINGMSTQLGANLPKEIYHFEVQLLLPMQIPIEQASLIKAWLNQIVDRLTCEYVSYNNVLIPTSELQKF